MVSVRFETAVSARFSLGTLWLVWSLTLIIIFLWFIVSAGKWKLSFTPFFCLQILCVLPLYYIRLFVVCAWNKNIGLHSDFEELTVQTFFYHMFLITELSFFNHKGDPIVYRLIQINNECKSKIHRQSLFCFSFAYFIFDTLCRSLLLITLCSTLFNEWKVVI